MVGGVSSAMPRGTVYPTRGLQGFAGAASATSSTPVTGMQNSGKLNEAQLRQMKRTGMVECATCASRQYQDGSDENVSFKAAAHISPSASVAVISGHEQEHVSNAYTKAAQNNGKVVNASVQIKMATCPECGRSYAAGGVTNTTIKYEKKDAYSSNKKSADYSVLAGRKVDVGV